MDLSSRKFKILEAIINDYIQTAEPIGSRSIAKKYGMGISSATIRNEMSDLEDMGLVNQPHASSGRIPSEKGYRLYVDSMMNKQALLAEEVLYLQRMISDNINHIEYMMTETAKALVKLTNYPAIVSEPYLKKTRIKHVQLVPIDERSVLIVLVTDAKTVKNQPVILKHAPGYETLTMLSQYLNKYLIGKTIQDIDRTTIDTLLEAFKTEAHVLLPILGVIRNMIHSEDDVRVVTWGTKNILAFPEFADIRKAEAIFQVLEERETLKSLMDQALSAAEGIQILIGTENNHDSLKDCSLIRASYSIDNESTGCIAVIGPTRMDYAQAVGVLEGVLQNLKQVLAAMSEPI